MNSSTTSATKGLKNLCYVITAACIGTSMVHLYMALSGIFQKGSFLYICIVGFCAVLIGSQAIIALTTQAIRAGMHTVVILVGLLTIFFAEGIVSVPTSQFAINLNMIKGTANQTQNSLEARQIRKAIERSENRISGLDGTLSKTRAENMTNRGAVIEAIDTEEYKIKQYRRELNSLDESSASVAFNEMMWGLSREGFANVMSASLTIIPACMSVMLGAMAWPSRKSTSSPVRSVPREPIGKKVKDQIRNIAG